MSQDAVGQGAVDVGGCHGCGRVHQGVVEWRRAREGVVSQQHRNPGLHGLPGFTWIETGCDNVRVDAVGCRVMV